MKYLIMLLKTKGANILYFINIIRLDTEHKAI